MESQLLVPNPQQSVLERIPDSQYPVLWRVPDYQQLVSKLKVTDLLERSTEIATNLEIEKFDGKNNFGLWQIKVRTILIQQELDEKLNENEAKPAEVTDAAWTKIERKALSTLYLSLAYEILYNVGSEMILTKLWKKLKDMYMTKSMTNMLYLKQRLFTLRMQEAANLYEHLNEFNKVVAQLTSIGVNLDDEDNALILLSLLLATYEYLVTTLLYGKENISVETVTTAFLSNEMRKLN